MGYVAMEVADRGSEAEQHLWQAVITHTIQEWLHGPLRLQREAERYLFNDQIDFPQVCQSAGMDAGRLRSKLQKFRRQADSIEVRQVQPVQAVAELETDHALVAA